MPPAPNPTIQRRRLSFGKVVRAKRKALGLSQEKLAERAGCDRQSINRVENAAYSPSLDRVFKLADALGLDLEQLFRDFTEADRQALPMESYDAVPTPEPTPEPTPARRSARTAAAR